MKGSVLRISDVAFASETAEFGNLEQFSAFLEDISEPGFGPKFSRSNVIYALKRGKITSWMRRLGEKNIADRLEKFRESSFQAFTSAFFMLHRTNQNRKVLMKDVMGLEAEKESLTNRFLRVDASQRLKRKYQRKASGNVLLYGPPGCGKTFLANAVAGETSRLFHNVEADRLMYVGVHCVFDVVRKLGDAVVFIDEMETLAMTRDGEDFRPRVRTNSFLTVFDKDMESSGISVIGATNAPWLLDNALLRSGRFENLVYVGVPCTETRASLFRHYSSGLPLGSVDFGLLAKKTEFYSCSDIELICNEAASIPWGDAVAGKPERDVRQEDFMGALESVDSTALPWFENASNLVMSESGKRRFAPMVKEVEKYKKWKRG